MATRLWRLNLWSDDELSSPSGATPSRATLSRCESLLQRLSDLVPEGDPVLTEETPPGRWRGLRGLAWCPTPHALKTLSRAGAVVSESPPYEVLRAVNGRRFCAELGQTLPGARYVTDLPSVLSTLAKESPRGAWLLKRPYGFAGRGRLVVTVGALGARERAWLERSLRGGEGLQVEPLVERRGDYGLHGFLSKGGGCWWGEPTEQRCDDSGAWQGSARAPEGSLTDEELNALRRSAREVAEALFQHGYHGPFGVDAFRWWDGGTARFNARCEVNARYSMGWAIGLGALRPDLEG